MTGYVYVQAFGPRPASTVSLAVTNVTGNVQCNSFAAGQTTRKRNIRLLNAGSATVFVEIGVSTVTAAVATGMPILPNTSEVFDGTLGSHVAAITAAGTATLYATPGDGV